MPAVTTEQMKQVDSLMVDDYRIELIQMMENAGRNLAVLARRLLDDEVGGRAPSSCWPGGATTAAAVWRPRVTC